MVEDVKNIGGNPIDKGKKSIDEIFEEHQKSLSALIFISTYSINNNSDNYNLPKQNKFLFQKWNKTFLVEKLKSKINIILKANFIVINVKECTLIYNDKSGQLPLKYYLVTLKNSKGKIERDVEITNNSKSDYRQFQADINSRYNDFAINMNESEFKTFVAEFISPKIVDNVTFYTNAGILELGKILYDNALATNDGIIWADENGYIKIDEKTYIKLAEASHYLPKLYKSNKTGTTILRELLTNVIECWSENIILPLIVLGHISMAIFYDSFTKKIGVPTLILFGETGTGKSTLATVGISMFGLNKEAMNSGGSTSKSNEYFCAKYNGLIVCTDDVCGEVLASKNFKNLIKGIYNAVPRTRKSRNNTDKVEYIHTCSPMVYSTNDSLPNLKEIINRINVVEMFGKVFKAEKFNYHALDKNNNSRLQELSLIIPEFLKYSINEVIELYNSTLEYLENSDIQDTQKRVVNNIAYAYTGIQLLLDISGIKIDNLNEMIIEYAKKQVEKYEDIKNVVDKVLSEIPVLASLNVIDKGIHFKIYTETNNDGKSEVQIRFHKGIVLSAINKYYAHDKSKRVDEELFSSYAKNHPRFRGHKSVRFDIDNKPAHSMCFDITGLDDYAEYDSIIAPMSTDELRHNVEGNNM